MFAFHYDPFTKLYAGSTPVDFDPLEPGRKLLPAFATDKPPLHLKGGFERIFNPARDEWEYIELEPSK